MDPDNSSVGAVGDEGIIIIRIMDHGNVHGMFQQVGRVSEIDARWRISCPSRAKIPAPGGCTLRKIGNGNRISKANRIRDAEIGDDYALLLSLNDPMG
jgi:hypothetical protein